MNPNFGSPAVNLVQQEPKQAYLNLTSARYWVVGIGCVLFVAAFPIFRLYWSNQNTKFLHGLAKAFPDRLGVDWTAGTVDGLPVFSSLVFMVAQFSNTLMFYAIEFGLLAALFWALFFIGCKMARRSGASLHFQICLMATLVLLASLNLRHGVLDGVAGQSLVGGYLQPAEFGVFFIAALALELGGYYSAAILLAAAPAALHAGYVIPSIITSGCILASGYSQRRRWPPIIVLLIAACLIVIPQIDLAIRFAPTDRRTFEEAAHILAFERIPHHSDPSRWLGKTAYIKSALGVVAIYLLPRGAIRLALCVLLAWAVAGTIFVLMTGNPELALIAPWRTSVITVSVSIAVISAWLIDFIIARTGDVKLRNLYAGVFAALALYAAGAGIIKKVSLYEAERPEYVSFIKTHHSPEDIYITDPSDEEFRLAAMTAQFASWKSHPYRDIEVLEWYKRVAYAKAVFNSPAALASTPAIDCAALRKLLEDYKVTHLLAKETHTQSACGFLDSVFSGKDATIFRVNNSAL